MKVLFIGGTGNISSATSRLCLKKGFELYLLNRGNADIKIEGAHVFKSDINHTEQVKALLKDHFFDLVVNWIAFKPEDILRDYELFKKKTNQYIFISSASCYQKPLSYPIITESTPLTNPFWKYSRDKIACEDTLIKLYRDHNFPMTIVRPSLTYETVIPVPIGAWKEYTLIDRIKRGKKIIIHGDGSSLWTITHAQDFAIGFTGLFGHQQAIGQSFHITSDEVLTWNQIYEAIEMVVGKKAEKVYIPSDYLGNFDEHLRGSLLGDKAVSAIFDNSKIKSFVPDFKAGIKFKEGIAKTIKWFEEDENRMIIKEETNVFIDQILSTYLR